MAVTRRQQRQDDDPQDDAAAAASDRRRSTGARRTTDAKANGKPVTTTDGVGTTRRSALLTVALALLAAAAVGGAAFWYWVVPHARTIDYGRKVLTPARLREHCEEHIGEPRVEEVAPGVFVALAYDLANTILIKTEEGHVVVDVAMNPERAGNIRRDLEAAAGKAPIHSIIYTHSHVDHVGGAEVWAENGTRIWATEALTGHFFKQYGVFRKTESFRAARQFASDVPLSVVPCSGLGAKADVELTVRTMAFLIPTHTFSGRTSFKAGSLTFELVEAHGETHDQLFVWIPEKETLLPGDNYYHSFPNLYTLRGSSPRPIREWIKSLDAMRQLDPAVLVPSHTQPLKGKELIARQLRDYRDGIQWVFTATVRGANEGRSLDELAETIALPPHLRAQPALDELYGQIDWSVRAIYTNELGWFDGRVEDLYQLPTKETATRLLSLMGGPARVLSLAEAAVAKGQDDEFSWALYLLKLLRDAASAAAGQDEVPTARVRELQIQALRGLGETVMNTNGRAYVFQVAAEMEAGEVAVPEAVLGDAFIEAIPIPLIFEVMMTRIIPELSVDTHETALYVIGGTKYWVTVRYGLVEVIDGDSPLPGTPEPMGTFETSEQEFRRIALKVSSPAAAVAAGRAKLTGELSTFVRMMLMFETGA